MQDVTQKVRLDFLDSLRGVAALMVAYFHYSRYFLHEGLATEGLEYEVFSFFNNYVDLGKVGVIVFFAISGMVIPFSLLSGKAYPIKRFLISRVARLYPLYWFSIPIGVFAYWYLEGKDILFVTTIVNFTMLQQFLFIDNVMGLYWTLQIELIFYGLCVFAFLCGWIQQPKKLFLLGCFFVFMAVIASWLRYSLQIKIPVALFLALAFMLWGAVWREYIINNDSKCRRYGFMLFGLLLFCMPIISLLAYNQDMGFSETWYRYVFSYYSAMVILIFFTSCYRIQNWFFSWLGRISYSVYLLHGAVFVVFMNYLGGYLISSYDFYAHFYVFICMLLTVLISTITYDYIEIPMIKFGKKMIDKLESNVRDCFFVK